jgi:hypothetical protein
VNLSRQRKLLDGIEETVRKIEADLTAALAVRDLAPLRKLRSSVQGLVTDSAAAVRELREIDSELTPVQIPTRKSSQSFAAVGRILETAQDELKAPPKRER